MICVFLLFCSAVLHSDYVSMYPGTVTQIEAPATVLLAHDFADGKYFEEITGEIYLDNELYIVADTLRTSLEYVPLEMNDPDKLLLMTCIPQAGRLIIVAEKQ